MNENITIPEEARRAAAEAVHGGAAYGSAAKRKADAALAAAAPLIVAAELERLAAQFDQVYAPGDHEFDWNSGYDRATDDGVERLRARAAELRGGAQ